MKTLSKVRFSRDFFQNEIANGNSDFRISKFCHKVKVAKRDCDFSMAKKDANEHKLRLESFRKSSVYGERNFVVFDKKTHKKGFVKLENPYFFKWKQQEKNFIVNNFSNARKKECQKLLWQIAFENRQKKRKQAVFCKLFDS